MFCVECAINVTLRDDKYKMISLRVRFLSINISRQEQTQYGRSISGRFLVYDDKYKRLLGHD